VKTGFAAARAERRRTGAAEDAADLPEMPATGGSLADTLSARSLTTYRLLRK